MLKRLHKLSVLLILLSCGESEVLQRVQDNAQVSALDENDVDAPTPGGDGEIVLIVLSDSQYFLDFKPGNDGSTPQDSLEYKIRYSTDQEALGLDELKPLVFETEWVSYDQIPVLKNLLPGTKYYINVLVRDLAQNEALYISTEFITAADNSPPALEENAELSVVYVDEGSFELLIPDAKDGEAEVLEYKIFVSLEDNITTLNTIQENGVVGLDWTTASDSYIVKELRAKTEYYCNALVRDTSGNISIYKPITITTTADDESPIPGDEGAITTFISKSDRVELSWEVSTDNQTYKENLVYEVYQSFEDNLDDLEAIKENGNLLEGPTSNLVELSVGELEKNTYYYYNVLVRDEEGNEQVYQSEGVNIPEVLPAPIPGNDGQLTGADITTKSLTLTWTKGTDGITAQENLKYQVYQSDTNYDSDITQIKANGTQLSSLDADFSEIEIEDLDSSTFYYFDVILVNEREIEASYETLVVSTLADESAPVPGNSSNVTLVLANLDKLGVTWAIASDNHDSSESLEYKVVRSISDNLQTVEDAENNGVVVTDWAENITSAEASGLTHDTDYYLTVLVKDRAGNKAVYNSVIGSTIPDGTSPTVGSSGAVAVSNITETTLDLTWTKGTDAITSVASLQYLVYQSSSDNMTSVADAETNGSPVGSYQSDIDSKAVSSLTVDTTYYFTVILKDLAGNKALYNSVSATTVDQTPPVPGASGVISTASISETGLTLNWTKSSDVVSDQGDLSYKVVSSSSSNIASVSDAEANGSVLQDWTNDIDSYVVTNLTYDTGYYFNILVRDEVGLKSAYVTKNETTLDDTTAPTPGFSGVVSTSNVTMTSMTASWTKATDDLSEQSSLQYLAYYSTANNISSPTDAESNGTAVGVFAADITSVNIAGLSANTIYYVNVMVKDVEDNKVMYSTKTVQSLPDDESPTVSNGNIAVSNVTETSLSLNWSKATDNYSLQSALEYKVVRSTTNNISTASDALSNGTQIQDWIADINSIAVSNLTHNTTHYFQVIVRDEAGNPEVAYTAKSQATLPDTTPPTVGGGGAITGSVFTTTSMTLSWTKATDDLYSQAQLKYCVYRSLSNNIGNVANAEANGTLINSPSCSLDIDTLDLTGLDPSTTYYFNVVVEDQAATVNKSAYSVETEGTIAAIHVAYEYRGGSDLRYITNETGSFVKGIVDNRSDIRELAIARQSDGTIHFSYYENGGSPDSLYYATGSHGGGFNAVRIYPEQDSTDTGEFNSIAVESDGTVHLLFTEAISVPGTDRSALYYTSGTYSSFLANLNTNNVEPEEVQAEGSQDTGNGIEMLIDGSGDLHFSYGDRTGDEDIRYGTGTTGSFDISAFVEESSNNELGSETAIGMDSQGNIHIAYHDNDANSVLYETNAGGNSDWSQASETVDGTSDRGRELDLAIDGSDKVHICYYDRTNDEIRYATNASGSWAHERVDTNGNDLGSYCSIGIGSSRGLVHITYFDATSNDVEYAYGSAGSWTLSTIDSDNAGTYLEMVVE